MVNFTTLVLAPDIEAYVRDFTPELTSELAYTFFTSLSHPGSNPDAFRLCALRLAEKGKSLGDLFALFPYTFDFAALIQMSPRTLRTLFRFGFPPTHQDTLILQAPFRDATPAQLPALATLLRLFTLYFGEEYLSLANAEGETLFDWAGKKGDRAKCLLLLQCGISPPNSAEYSAEIQSDMHTFSRGTFLAAKRFETETILDEEVYEHYFTTLLRSPPTPLRDDQGEIMQWPDVEIIAPAVPCRSDTPLLPGSLFTQP